jgi:dihydroneopterin aldolase
MDSILINGLKIHARHGVMAAEKALGQTFVIDAVLKADLSKACASDRLQDTVNYAAVVETLQRTMTSEDNNLVERAAQRLAEAVLAEHPLVAEVEITLKKPHAPIPALFDYVGVSIVRRRNP